jgi:hypothetical protein
MVSIASVAGKQAKNKDILLGAGIFQVESLEQA